MFPIVAKVKRWWQPDSSRPERLAAFRVQCSCGELTTGARKGHFQVLPCGRCGRELFVLPLSPLPSVADSLLEVRKSGIFRRPPVGKRPRRWRWALLALGVAVVAVAYGAAYGPWSGTAPEQSLRSPRGKPPAEAAEQMLKNARSNLAVGNFRLAQSGLLELSGTVPRRQWLPLWQQAGLLADLSAESLEEILAHAAGVPSPEWEAEFPVRYRGKAVLFDLELSGPPGGPYRHSWQLRRDVHMDFAEVRLLRRLPLAEPTRLLFGARLDRVGRDTPTSWEIHFEPDSGVLLTDAGAAAACCPFLGEAELDTLLRRQSQWLER